MSIIQLPRDAGLAAGRNELIRNTLTEYFLYFDDDFWLEDNSHAHRLVQYLSNHPKVDIVGGTVSDRPEYTGFDFDIVSTISSGGDKHDEYVKKTLIQRAVPKHMSQCTKVDIVPNFFAARTASLKKVKWDPHFKLGEHEDFFVRAKAKGLHVESCSKMSIAHHAPNTKWYYSSTNNEWLLAKKKAGLHVHARFFKQT